MRTTVFLLACVACAGQRQSSESLKSLASLLGASDATAAWQLGAAPAKMPTRNSIGSRSAAPVMQPSVNDMIGKYQNGQVFDPLNLADKYDLNWLREAELKHGRVCMLAYLGWLANDAGLKFPGEAFQGISSLQAHDAMIKAGYMQGLLLFVGICEALHMSVVIPRLDGDWTGYEPGNYGIDPFKLDTPYRREAELKNGRLAMLAFSGLVTQAALGYSAPYFPVGIGS